MTPCFGERCQWSSEEGYINLASLISRINPSDEWSNSNRQNTFGSLNTFMTMCALGFGFVRVAFVVADLSYKKRPHVVCIITTTLYISF